jgi:diguanylate cyclase (GGDEF)-like protein
MKELHPKNNAIFYFVMTFSIIFIASFGVLYYIETKVVELKDHEVIDNELKVTDFQKSIIEGALRDTISDLMYLKNAYGQVLTGDNFSDIEKNWAVFSDEKKVYDQIRFIDQLGNEKIRINYKNNKSEIVSGDNLQNKSNRYYFQNTISIEENSVYISPVDLNMERGLIEKPLNPMMRLGAPVYDRHGKSIGAIIINYKADYFLDVFSAFSDNSLGQVYLLNEEGFWIDHKDKNMEWTFMYPEFEGTSFASENKNSWQRILNGDRQFLEGDALYTISEISLMKTFEGKEKTRIVKDIVWYVVSTVKSKGGNAIYKEKRFVDICYQVLQKNYLFFLMIVFISLIVSVLLNMTNKNYLKIRYLSEYDEMTGVLNRRAGIEKLEAYFNQRDKALYPISLCYLDINGLKEVNDRLGHSAGDQLLIKSIDIIQSVIRRDDFVIRLGGDEFLIVFLSSNEEVTEIVWERILVEINAVNRCEALPYLISISHGVVEIEGHRQTVDELIKEADEKMYEEKKKIKSSLKVIQVVGNTPKLCDCLKEEGSLF